MLKVRSNCKMDSTCAICQKWASKICSACRLVSYCSVEHQKSHWKEHKKNCRIFIVKKNETYGRYIVASRDIPAGTVIMNEAALAIGPKQDTPPICLGCHKDVDGSYRCSKCSYPMCNISCEKAKMHANNECKIFQRNKNNFTIANPNDNHPAYECILTVRCLLLKENDPKKWERLLTMEPHNEIRKQFTELWSRNQINTVKLLRERYKMEEFDEMMIHSVLGYADVNAFEIKPRGVEICGLFPDVALMAHECVSNTHHSITDDNRMIVRVVIPLKKGDLITTTYTHTLEGTLDRRRYIKESKFFDCTCKRCADPTELGTYFSGIKCSMKKCPGYLLPNVPLEPLSKWSCTECHHTLPVDEIEKIVQDVRKEITKARKTGHISQLIPLFEDILEKVSGKILHPNHFLITGLIHSLSQLYGRTTGWLLVDLTPDLLRRKEMLCRRLLSVIDIIEPGLSRIRGLTLYELHAPLYMLTQEEFRDKKITEDELKSKLDEVLGLLEISYEILSFDSVSSSEALIAKSIPETIESVKSIRDHFFANNI